MEAPKGWRKVFAKFAKKYPIKYNTIVKHLQLHRKTPEWYPPPELVFNAFEKTRFKKVRVVLLGQDPYHGKGQAMGLSFSVNRNHRIQESLQRIFKELKDDIGIDSPPHGDLTKWAEQGVLLLNTALTVEQAKPKSHMNIWTDFTNFIIQTISKHNKNVVFLLWGNPAKEKASLIDRAKHRILEASHPSPLCPSGFLGCKHFSLTNKYFQRHNLPPIDWSLN